MSPVGIKKPQILFKILSVLTKSQCAFVSTNSICQGIAVPPLWHYLLDKKFFINFAHQTFVWDSESTQKTAVHCVIVGFSKINNPRKKLFNGENFVEVENINPYLLPAPNIIVEPQEKSFYDVPPMFVGVMPCDGGNLILSEVEREKILKKYPEAEKFIKVFMSAEDFLYNKKRFCLWLKDFSPTEIKKIPPIYERVQKVKIFRENSKSKENSKLSKTPTLFVRSNFISAKKIFIPMLSSCNREYIPIDFVDAEVVVNNLTRCEGTSKN